MRKIKLLLSIFIVLISTISLFAFGSSGGVAIGTFYDNIVSGITSNNVQGAIDELALNIAAYSTSAGVSDEAYDADTWNGITTLAPSKNAVRDKIESLSTVYQPLDSDLTTWAGVTSSANGRSLVSAADYAAMRTLLGLVVGTNVQAYDADLTTYAGITPSANIQTFLGSANYSAARTNLGIAIGSDVQAYDYELGSLSAGIIGLVKGAGNDGGYSAAVAGTDYLAGSALSDNAYGAGWDSDTTHTATKNAIYDVINGLSSTYQGLDSDLTALAGISGVRGDIIYYGASGWTRLAKGTENYHLVMGANDPAWAADTGGGASAFDDLSDVTITSAEQGDVLYYNGSAWVNLVHGTSGQYLKTGGNAANPSWDTPSGAGDMLAASYPHIVAIEALAVTDGNVIVGNGSTWVAESGSTARASLGLAIGTNVQAYDADLTTYAGITPSANVQTMLGSANNAEIRSNIGLAIGTNVQAYDADLTTWAGVTPSANGQSLVAAANYSAMRTLLTLVPGTDIQAYDADLTSIAGGIIGVVKGAGNGAGFSAAVAGTDYVGLASANTLTGNNVFGDADTDTLTIRSLIVGGNSRAVWIAGSAPTPTYATGTNELYVAGDVESGGTIYATSFVSTATSNFQLGCQNNSSGYTASTYALYPDAGTWKLYDTAERTILTDSLSATLTGTTWNFAGVTNLRLPTADADSSGEISINPTSHQLKLHDGNALQSIDFDGQVAGYVLKSDGAGNWTPQADATAGSPTLNSVGDPTADTTISMDAGEEVNLQYTGNFTTGSQFLVRQLTGNPSGGVLFEVRAADSDVVAARIGDGTNYTQFSQAGNITLAGTATLTGGDDNITAGGITFDSTPGASGDIGYASNAYTLYANSEDMVWTAGTNTWTYSSSTGANLVLGTPSATSLSVGSLLGVDSIDATGAVDMDYGSADITDHTFISDGGTVVIDGSIQFPDANASPTIAGQLLYDNTITGLDDGGFVWYDDDEIQTLCSLASSTTFGAGQDGYQVTYHYNSGNGYFDLQAPGAGGGLSLAGDGTPDGQIQYANDANDALAAEDAFYYEADTNTLYVDNISATTITLAASDNPYSYYNELDGTDWWTGIDDAGNSFEWRTNATVGNSVQMELTESGDLTTTGDVIITGSDLTIGAAGVKITGDGDGAITFLGLGNGYDEDLTLNLDDTDNTAKFSSSTGVTTMDFSAINLVTTGSITGLVPVTSTTAGVTLTSTQCRGSFIMVTSAGTVTLPAAATAGYGAAVCIYVRDASETVTVEVDNADKIRLYATALDAGDTIDSPGAAGNFICLISTTDADGSGTDGWITLGSSGTWTDGGAS